MPSRPPIRTGGCDHKGRQEHLKHALITIIDLDPGEWNFGELAVWPPGWGGCVLIAGYCDRTLPDAQLHRGRCERIANASRVQSHTNLRACIALYIQYLVANISYLLASARLVKCCLGGTLPIHKGVFNIMYF